MLDRAAKTFFHLLARSRPLEKLASRYGMRRPESFARRFIAGESVREAIETARALEARRMRLTLDLLGESVTNLEEADAATRQYVDNLRKILERAEPAGFFIRIDMENSPYTDVTLEIFETLWSHGYRQIGVVLQSALYRSEADLERMNALGARVRLVKGAYKEPKSVAYQNKADVDAAYERMMKSLLIRGHSPAIATHDPAMIDATRRWAREQGVAPDAFEFQMLYGIRRDLQTMLVNEQYRLRVYIPFGRQWFPYFMRRLGERPANVSFVIRGVFGEQR